MSTRGVRGGDLRPPWADEPVEVVVADPCWPAVASALVRRLTPLLEPWLDGDVEHVGSTAVPGLAAKPIVDLAAPWRPDPADPVADAVLRAEGWRHVPSELDRRAWRRFFVLPRGERRHAHLHLVDRSSGRWEEMLAFREALRADPTRAEAYAALKRVAADRFARDREAYTDAKTAFIRETLGGAG